MGDRLRVLLVDDDELFRSFVRHLLRASEIDLDEVTSLTESRARLAVTRYDAVLLDLHLPDGVGLALLDHLRERELFPAIVMLTSDDDERTAHHALRCGAEEYIVKTTVNRRVLQRVLRHSVERARHRRANVGMSQPVDFLQLAGGIAHQVSNPAAFVQANLGVLVQQIDALERLVFELSSLNADERAPSSRSLACDEATARLAELRGLLADNEEGMRRISAVVKELRALSGIDAASMSTPPPASCALRAENTASRKRVLLIDDEPALLRAYQRMLRPYYDTVVATGGAEALHLLELDASFDAVICDVVMPEVDGTMVFRTIEKRFPALCEKFLFCTGGVFTAAARELVVRASTPILEKPIDEHLLHQALARITGRAGSSPEARAAVTPKPTLADA